MRPVVMWEIVIQCIGLGVFLLSPTIQTCCGLAVAAAPLGLNSFFPVWPPFNVVSAAEYSSSLRFPVHTRSVMEKKRACMSYTITAVLCYKRRRKNDGGGLETGTQSGRSPFSVRRGKCDTAKGRPPPLLKRERRRT